MKNIIVKLLCGGLLCGAMAATPLLSSTVHAQVSGGLDMAKQADVGKQDVNGLVKNSINILLFIVGIISVVMIIIGGIKYSTSNGDSAKVTAAKNTVLYSVVGLVVAIFAFAIVNFVVTNITGSGSATKDGGSSNTTGPRNATTDDEE